MSLRSQPLFCPQDGSWMITKKVNEVITYLQPVKYQCIVWNNFTLCITKRILHPPTNFFFLLKLQNRNTVYLHILGSWTYWNLFFAFRAAATIWQVQDMLLLCICWIGNLHYRMYLLSLNCVCSICPSSARRLLLQHTAGIQWMPCGTVMMTAV